MSRSPTGNQQQDPQQAYLSAWQDLAKRISQGQSFSGRERNCVFLNTRGPRFADVSAVMGLDYLDDSRAVAVTDWDQDGDLDLWVASRTAPRIRFLRNDVKNENHSVSFRLIGDPRARCPRDAIGARVILTVRDADGNLSERIQTLAAGDGFLSQSSKRLFFGIEKGAKPEQVVVRWPGSNEVERFDGLSLNQHFCLEQGTGIAARLSARGKLAEFTDTRTYSIDSATPPASGKTRVWRSSPLPVPSLRYESLTGESCEVSTLHRGPLFITLWATWCLPCVEELKVLTKHQTSIVEHGATVLALNVELLEQTSSSKSKHQISQVLKEMEYPFFNDLANVDLLQQLDSLRKQTIYRDEPMPLPTGFLLDEQGRLRVVYTGVVELESLLDDLQHLQVDKQESRDRAIPFAGRWSDALFVTNPIAIATIYREERQLEDAVAYLQQYLAKEKVPDETDQTVSARQTRRRLADVHRLLGRIALDQQSTQAALDALKQALRLDPFHFDAHVDLGQAMMRAQRSDLAVKALKRAVKIRRDDPNSQNQLGLALLGAGDIPAAVASFEKALSLDPKWLPAANNLAWLWATHPDDQHRDAGRAVDVAEQSVRHNGERPDVLDTLAAAYAANGDFEQAIETAARALGLAKKMKRQELAQRIESRLQLYRSGQVYRDP